LAVRFSDQISFLKSGKIVSSGIPNEIVNPEMLEDVFGVKTMVIKHPLGDYPLVILK
jgi:iron complex transport system ATP-binding protein